MWQCTIGRFQKRLLMQADISERQWGVVQEIIGHVVESSIEILSRKVDQVP